jgi:hypothetical protein
MEEDWDTWFTQARPMTKPKKTWREKCLAKEENSSDISSDEGEQGKETPRKRKDGEDSVGLPGAAALNMNMVFIIPGEFQAPENKVVELTIGEEHTVFKKSKTPAST